MDFEAVRNLCGRRRTLEILYLLGEEGPHNYSDIEEDVPTSSDVIVNSLELLVEYDLVERTERTSKDVSYRVTEKGERVLDITESLEHLLTGAEDHS